LELTRDAERALVAFDGDPDVETNGGAQTGGGAGGGASAGNGGSTTRR
jgi:hypothetical protein